MDAGTSTRITVLQGFDQSKLHPPLRYGDRIALIPNGINGIACYDRSLSNEPSVEILPEDEVMPPNVELCHWKIIPKLQYEAAKSLKKLLRKGTWDGGQGLALPPPPSDSYHIDAAVNEFAQAHRIQNSTDLKEVFRLLMDVEEERNANEAEERRQRGNIIKYGDTVQFIHSSSGLTLTITKKQGVDKGCKALEMLQEGVENSIFVVLPAYKTFGQGEPVTSGDLICFYSEKKIVGNICCLHVSARPQKYAGNVLLSAPVYELDASILDTNATSWRALLFQSSSLAHEVEGLIKSEDVVCIYHKDGESYLNYDPILLPAPFFHLRQKVKPSDRKKAGWLWKIEGECIYLGGQNIECDDRKRYRLKHLVTGHYLKSQDGSLSTVTSCSEGTLFSFRHFAKDVASKSVLSHSLIMIQGNGWLSMSYSDKDVAERAGKKIIGHKAISRDFHAIQSERDAFVLMPVSKKYETTVNELKSELSTLISFRRLLKNCSDIANKDITIQNLLKGELPNDIAAIIKLFQDHSAALESSITNLILECSADTDPNPLTREGRPKILIQKLLREMDAHSVCLDILETPFKKGFQFSWLDHDNLTGEMTSVLRLGHRFIMHFVKENEPNAQLVYTRIEMLKDQLGKGVSATVSIKEIFFEKRRMLNLIRPHDVKIFMEMLQKERDPRHIDFLVSICTCGRDPIPSNQSLVCDKLYKDYFSLIPRYRLQTDRDEKKMLFMLPSTGNENWIDMSSYMQNAERTEKGYDYASSIMFNQFNLLKEKEKHFRYFLRCTSLLNNLVVGRNHEAMAMALKNNDFSLTFEDIFDVMTSSKVPSIIRARFTNLMLKFHVDRDPQTSKPQVSYTRTWSKAADSAAVLLKKSSTLGAIKRFEESEETTRHFRKLTDFLIDAISTWEGEKSGVTRGALWTLDDATYGEVDLILSWIELSDWLIDFGYIVENRDAIHADFKYVMKLFEGLFRIIKVKKLPTRMKDDRVEMMRTKARSETFKLLSRICNLRANYRITCALKYWEDIFEKLDGHQVNFHKTHFSWTGSNLSMSFSSNSGSRDDLLKNLRDEFRPYEQDLVELIAKIFDQNIVSPASMASDLYKKGGYREDVTISSILSFIRLGDVILTEHAVVFLITHLFQRNKFVEDLKFLQVLVYPEAVKLYNEIKHVIERLTALKKTLDVDDENAYEEANTLLQKMIDNVTLSKDIPKEIVAKNQRIMLNWELDEPVIDLLRLNITLSSDDVHEAGRQQSVDRRKKLFQRCYNFLKVLCADHPRAQQKLFPSMSVFLDHVGIENLNVSDTLREIVRNNPRLCSQVPEHFFRHFLNSIKKHGRNARWLRFFDVFLFINNSPLKRSQDLILRLIMEDKDDLIDLTCDYRQSRWLQPSDPRYGKDRLTLMIEGEHKRELGSLLRYHVACLEILALCATGKNVANKVRIIHEVSFETILSNILDLNMRESGKREMVEVDTLHFVKNGWMRLITETYLTSYDIFAIKQIQSSTRIWPSEYYRTTQKFGGSQRDLTDSNATCLLVEFERTVEFLITRLKTMTNNEDLSSVKEDSHGSDIASHVNYVANIIVLLKELFKRADICDTEVLRHPVCKAIHEQLRSSFNQLNKLYIKISKLEESRNVVELLTFMHERGILGEEFDIPPDDEEEDTKPKSKEMKFQEGWGNYCEVLADKLGLDSRMELLQADAIKDFARTIMSDVTSKKGDYTVVKEFCRVLTSKTCDPSVQTIGLKVLRAIIYMNPVQQSEEEQDESYHRMLRNLDPDDKMLEQESYVELQMKVAKAGGIQVILHFLAFTTDSSILHSCLCFANALLHGGNKEVQEAFAKPLTSSSSQHLFGQIFKIFQDAVEGIKEVRKKAKQEDAERVLSNRRLRSKSKSALADAFGESQLLITEVMKMMRRLCMGQNQPLQDIFRVQSLNKISVNFLEEVVKYQIVLEPELKSAIQKGDFVLAEAAIRGFLMLADSMHGPNYHNQESIATADFFDLCDRIFHKIRFEEVKEHAPILKRRSSSMNRVFPDAVTEAEKNQMRSRLKVSVISCIYALLEGVQGDVIPQRMITTVSWTAMVTQMGFCYEMRENKTGVEEEDIVREGLIYYFVLKFVREYDRTGTIQEALHTAPIAARFFEQRTGYVEIQRAGRLEIIFFQLPDKCIEGGPLDDEFLEMYNTEREDPDKKNQGFLENVCKIVAQEEFHSNLRKTAFSFTINKWDLICRMTYIWVLLLHAVMVLGSYAPNHVMSGLTSFQIFQNISSDVEVATYNDEYFYFKVLPKIKDTARYMCIVNLVLCAIRLLSFSIAHVPMIVIERQDTEAAAEEEEEESRMELSASSSNDDGDGDNNADEQEGDAGEEDTSGDNRVDDTNKKTQKKRRRRKMSKGTLNIAWIVLSSGAFIYEVLFFLFALAAVVSDAPLFTTFTFLEVFFFNSSKTVVDAMKFKAFEMLNTFVIGLVFMYIWMVIGMLTFEDIHQDGDGNYICVNMFQCFLAYIFIAMRGDGVRDVTTSPTFPTNIVDAVSYPSYFLIRLLWDLIYQWLFIYVLLAIITGIVIDAFSGLRDERETAENDLKSTCFICNLERFRIDQNGSGFEKHIRQEHNPRWYLFFLIYIKSKQPSYLTGQEKFVYEQVWPAKGHLRFDWLPRERTFHLSGVDEADDTLSKIDNRMDAFEAKLSSCMDLLKEIQESLQDKEGKD